MQVTETKLIPENNYINSGMAHFTGINQTPPPTQCCRMLEKTQRRSLQQETILNTCKQHL